jgi:RHS repeat-associated protein
MKRSKRGFLEVSNRIIAEAFGAGLQVREYIWAGDQIIAVIANANTTPVIYYVTNDHLGRPVQMTDAAQAVVWRAKYKPFGEVSAITGAASLDYRWPGQWFQLESGLAYNWHRHYDATLGRYTQPDPLGHPDGPSVYGYVGQNPMGGVDPEGLEGLDPVTYSPLYYCLSYPQICGATLGKLLDVLENPPEPNYCPIPPDSPYSKQWQCEARCNVQEIPGQGAQCPDRVFGSSGGTSRDNACLNARRIATQSTPRGCYPRHCNCTCNK